jgi:phosphoribosylaminoimidazolecarboxamide formyltransferase/IMP cyclohydrolase
MCRLAIGATGGMAIRVFRVIEACNEAGSTMVFTGQRAFKH